MQGPWPSERWQGGGSCNQKPIAPARLEAFSQGFRSDFQVPDAVLEYAMNEAAQLLNAAPA
jgi:hypothetical protein